MELARRLCLLLCGRFDRRVVKSEGRFTADRTSLDCQYVVVFQGIVASQLLLLEPGLTRSGMREKDTL